MGGDNKPEKLDRSGKRIVTVTTTGSGVTELENSLRYLIRDTHRLISRLLTLRLEKIGVRVGEWYILRALLKEDGITQRDLSVRIGMNEPNIVTSIRDLEIKDIIRRSVDEKDRRCKRVSLTKARRKFAQSLLPIVSDVNDTIASPLNGTEREPLLSMVQRVRRSLE